MLLTSITNVEDSRIYQSLNHLTKLDSEQLHIQQRHSMAFKHQIQEVENLAVCSTPTLKPLVTKTIPLTFPRFIPSERFRRLTPKENTSRAGRTSTSLIDYTIGEDTINSAPKHNLKSYVLPRQERRNGFRKDSFDTCWQ